MSEKIEAQGDIGQIIEGNVHEAPRFNNVVNLNLSEAKKEVQRITEYQRKRINMLVKEWAAICGDKEIEIYKIFIADYGIQYFRELPIEHYTKVKETLEGWIDRREMSRNKCRIQSSSYIADIYASLVQSSQRVCSTQTGDSFGSPTP